MLTSNVCEDDVSIKLTFVQCLYNKRRGESTPNFLVTHMLFAHDLSLISNDPSHEQTVLNKLSEHARRQFLTVDTQKSEVMCFNSHTNDLPPSLMMAQSSFTHTPSSIWAWPVTEISM